MNSSLALPAAASFAGLLVMALALVWLVWRVFPKPQERAPSSEVTAPPAPKQSAPVATERDSADDPYTIIVGVRPHEAEEMLGEFERANVRFQLDLDQSAGGLSRYGSPRRGAATVYIHEADKAKAAPILARYGTSFDPG
jgi:hypothetical protein